MKRSCYPARLIDKYYSDNLQARKILMTHSRLVTRKSLKIARHLLSLGTTVDIQFLAEAAMLHDIGMFLTNTPDLSCHGKGDYIQHGIKGKKLLEQEGLFKHARVCERHIGVGLTSEDIINQHLPLPIRDMLPETLEEQIICYADLFYSKGNENLNIEKSPEKILKTLHKFGPKNVKIFNQWHEKFEHPVS